jgi:hypothetical protein
VAKRTCSIEGCESAAKTRGWCNKHYLRWWQTGSTDPRVREQTLPCSIDGCNAVTEAHGWCDKHYKRWRAYGSPMALLQRDQETAVPPCRVEDCDTSAHSRGWCAKHYARWLRTGDTEGLRAKGPIRSDMVGNGRAHGRVRKDRGIPSSHQCIDCGKTAAHWSYDHADPDELTSEKGPYSLDVERYQPRCVPCHKRFDLAILKSRVPTA